MPKRKFNDALKQLLDAGDVHDIRDNRLRGVQAALPMRSYATDLYAAHGEEMWDMMKAAADQFGYKPLEWLGGREGAADVDSPESFTEHLVHTCVLMAVDAGL